MEKPSMRVKFLLYNAVIAAIYGALTQFMAPISYGPVQVRLSEFMTLLAFINPKCIPGLVLGCLLANLDSPFGITDIVVGTLATYVAVKAMGLCPNMLTASLMPVLANGVIIGGELCYLGAIPDGDSVLGVMVYIALGEFLSVTVLGLLITRLLLKNSKIRESLTDF